MELYNTQHEIKKSNFLDFVKGFFYLIAMASIKKHSNFKIKYDIESGQVDVNTLLNSLFHTTAILQEINDELNREFGTNKKLEIKINAFSESSFLVDCFLDTKTITDLFTGENLKTLGILLSVFAGTIKLWKTLKGRKPDKKEQTKNGNYELL